MTLLMMSSLIQVTYLKLYGITNLLFLEKLMQMG